MMARFRRYRHGPRHLLPFTPPRLRDSPTQGCPLHSGQEIVCLSHLYSGCIGGGTALLCIVPWARCLGAHPYDGCVRHEQDPLLDTQSQALCYLLRGAPSAHMVEGHAARLLRCL